MQPVTRLRLTDAPQDFSPLCCCPLLPCSASRPCCRLWLSTTHQTWRSLTLNIQLEAQVTEKHLSLVKQRKKRSHGKQAPEAQEGASCGRGRSGRTCHVGSCHASTSKGKWLPLSEQPVCGATCQQTPKNCYSHKLMALLKNSFVIFWTSPVGILLYQ